MNHGNYISRGCIDCKPITEFPYLGSVVGQDVEAVLYVENRIYMAKWTLPNRSLYGGQMSLITKINLKSLV